MANNSTVRHISECFIKPKYEVETAKKPVYLSPMELVSLTTGYIQNGLLFTRPTNDPIDNLLLTLKTSLSMALVHFYPLAGQFETQVDQDDEQTSLVVFVSCNKGSGVKFIHATVQMTVSDILSAQYVPDAVQSSFFDHHGAVNHDGHTKPLLSIQVTELVDGVFIGCSMNHVIADGKSFWHFFNMWSEIFMANGETDEISQPPIHERWLIDGVGPIIKLPFRPHEFISRPATAPNTLIRSRFFHLSAESIAKLKAKANADCGTINKISSFQALVAFVWRSITRARCDEEDTETSCKFYVDYRRRVEPPLSENYFGQKVQTMQGRCKAGDMLSRNLGSTALLLNKLVVDHTDKKVRSVMEEWLKSPFVIDMRSCYDYGCISIGNSPRFDVYGPEFGMGKAVAVLSGYSNKFDGKVTTYPGRDGGGTVDLEICLGPDTMSVLESDEEFVGLISPASSF